jgi:hypothetical protein
MILIIYVFGLHGLGGRDITGGVLFEVVSPLASCETVS